MKCVIPGANIRILAKAIHALAKVGDEMYVQPHRDSLSLRTVNLANSAYADFTFTQNYFSYYVFGNLEEDDVLKCKISMRSAMTVFKATHVIDKQVETCHIKLEPDASVILFILKYKNSIIKTHLLPIIDAEKLQAAYIKDGVPNQLSVQPRVLGDVVLNFQQNLIEITLEVSSQKILLRNYIDDTLGTSNITRTQLALGVGEFDRYVVGTETTITFCMKELRAFLAFAETVMIPISIYFESAGRPVVFVLKSSTYEANLVLSTLNPDVDNQSDSTVMKKQAKPTRRRASSKKETSSRAGSRILSSSNKLPNVPTLASRHPCFEEDDSKSIHDISNGGEAVKESVANSNCDKNRNTETSRRVSQKVSNDPVTPSTSRARNGNSPGTNKKVVQSIFSNIVKRKSGVNRTQEEEAPSRQDDEDLDETVPNSPPPPAKKARIIFKKCFQSTFDERMLPGHDTVLAEDSDESKSD